MLSAGVLERHRDFTLRPRHPSDDVTQLDGRVEPVRNTAGKTVVAIGKPEDAIAGWSAFRIGFRGRCELIDEGEQRQVLGIRQEEAPQCAEPRFEPHVRMLRLQPSGDRPPGNRPRNGRIPSLVGEFVVVNLSSETARCFAECRLPGANPSAALVVRTVKSPASPQDPSWGQTQV